MGHRVVKHGTTGTPLARCLAAFAALEEASVRAFDELAEQLESWGAPEQFITRCKAAAKDEVRHFELLSTLARDGGASLPESSYDEVSQTLFEVALHNAVEGCVGETWSAYLAHCWARRSESRDLRQVFAQIAEDETRHAQLSWDLHEWFVSKLSPARAKAVEDARRTALTELPELARRQVRGLPDPLGTPSIELAAHLARDFAGRLGGTFDLETPTVSHAPMRSFVDGAFALLGDPRIYEGEPKLSELLG
jgi:rubrerythrin